MPVMYVQDELNHSRYAILGAEVKLIAAVFEVAKATSGIRANVFDSEEYSACTKKKVRYIIPDLFLCSYT